MTCGDSNVVFTCTKGVWTSTVLGPSSPGRPFLGFDAKDQFYSLQCIGYPHGTTQWSYVLYSELP